MRYGDILTDAYFRWERAGRPEGQWWADHFYFAALNDWYFYTNNSRLRLA